VTPAPPVARRLEGRVALVTGAARGIGRAVCVRLAGEGAAIVATDLCGQLEGAAYATGTRADLDETVRLVEEAGGEVLALAADVRDTDAVNAVAEAGRQRFGGIDIVCAAAGTASFGPLWELTDDAWDLVVDTNLTGVFKTLRAVIPDMIERGRGGSLILISSLAGLRGLPGAANYVAAKHGLVGLARNLCNDLGPHMIRTNTVHPTTVNTPLVQNEATYRLFRPDLDQPTAADFAAAVPALNAMPVAWAEPSDIADAVAWLASDESRYVTGAAIPVDAGSAQKFP
jgi:SDR family mycofactocin-dependent oxidoreductase